ncbi:MAG: peptide chain release factor-like protein [Gemmatimonadetes bacterium]|nr:peptide chain release factor-like protein [Gemmatimonadota bacterium]MEE2906123.1 peptide chain release factor-like protein [Gemmatimonadota bacterium]
MTIPEEDEKLLAECRVETFRSGGPGGQHQNVTESGVRLVHIPTGIRVAARDERSQHRNRRIALKRLRDKLTELSRETKARVPSQVPTSERAKRLHNKRKHARKKSLRKRPELEDE